MSCCVSGFQSIRSRPTCDRSTRYSTVAGMIIAWRERSTGTPNTPRVSSLSATTSKREENTVSEFCFSNASIALPTGSPSS